MPATAIDENNRIIIEAVLDNPFLLVVDALYPSQ
jgi:hypothetical protein